MNQSNRENMTTTSGPAHIGAFLRHHICSRLVCNQWFVQYTVYWKSRWFNSSR